MVRPRKVLSSIRAFFKGVVIMAQPLPEALHQEIVKYYLAAGFPPEHAEQVPGLLAETILNLQCVATADAEDTTWSATFSWGGRYDACENAILPGDNETALGRAVTYYRRRFMGIQWEVAHSLPHTDLERDNVFVAYPPKDPISGHRLHYSTSLVLQDIITAAERHGIDTCAEPVLLIAGWHHLPRVIKIAQKAGLTRIAFPPRERLFLEFDTKCFCPTHRTFEGWWYNEAMSRLGYERDKRFRK